MAGNDPRAAELHPPVAAQLAHDRACGIGRVVAFIGVSVLGALVIAAVQQRPSLRRWWCRCCRRRPRPGCCTGSNHGWHTTWRTALLAEMRIDLYRKLDALAPAYLLDAGPATWWRWRPRM